MALIPGGINPEFSRQSGQQRRQQAQLGHLADLTESDPDKLKFGGKVELVIVPFRTEGDKEIVSFAFKPV